ncbi:MAG: hypothetical protein II463_01290 [Bacteroidaceae bacterium]|nr:hypothetical protein [Bacteroidaceae bacterium]
MLKDNLYHIKDNTAWNDQCRFDISLETGSVIYKAHFPGQPITPGVCLMQIAVELLSIHMGCEYKLSSARNVKFVSPVIPVEGRIYSFTFSNIKHVDKCLSARVTVTSGDTVHAKMTLSVIQ